MAKQGLARVLEDCFYWKVRIERHGELLGLCEDRLDPNGAFKDAGDFVVHIHSGHTVGMGRHIFGDKICGGVSCRSGETRGRKSAGLAGVWNRGLP